MGSVSSIYPGLPAVLEVHTVSLDQQQKQFMNGQWEFWSIDDVSLLQCVHLIKLKTHKIGMWFLFYTRKPKIIESYFVERGLKLELKSRLTPHFYLSRTFWNEEICKIYLIIQGNNQFKDKCNMIIEEALKEETVCRAKL